MAGPDREADELDVVDLDGEAPAPGRVHQVVDRDGRTSRRGLVAVGALGVAAVVVGLAVTGGGEARSPSTSVARVPPSVVPRTTAPPPTQLEAMADRSGPVIAGADGLELVVADQGGLWRVDLDDGAIDPLPFEREDDEDQLFFALVGAANGVVGSDRRGWPEVIG